MDRQEIITLLKDLMGAYPQANIRDAEATFKIWMMTISEFDADDVFEASRLHIQRSKYFPTPHDIIDLIPTARLSLMAKQAPTPMLASSAAEDDADPSIETDEIWQIFGKGLGY